MSRRTWTTVHRRNEVLRSVIEEIQRRTDGRLPMELPGVAETFGDELDLLAALQMRWHTRLAGRIEGSLMDQPTDPVAAVLIAWRQTATELAGVRRVLDAYTEHPTSAEMADALHASRRKDWALLGAMTGRPGRAVEEQARAEAVLAA